MNIWDIYEEECNAKGSSRYKAGLGIAMRNIFRNAKDNISYYKIKIFRSNSTTNIDCDYGETAEASIVSTNQSNIYEVSLIPGYDIFQGDIIYWKDNYWIVTSRSAVDTVYTKAEIILCNHLLKWVNPKNNKVVSQWCSVSDISKTSDGEYSANGNTLKFGETRLQVIMSRNPNSLALERNVRFLIGDDESDFKIAYNLTKPLKIGNSLNTSGLFVFIVDETVTTDNDNIKLGIADYYKAFPRPENQEYDHSSEPTSEREVWI